MKFDLNSIIQTAHALADAAREPALKYFRMDGLTAENKEADRFDPVTEGDRAVERAIRDKLDELRPNDAVTGEEYGSKSGSTGIEWIIDPIDGTRAYLCGAPVWGTLIAAISDNQVLCGVIEQPFTGERFFGCDGVAEWTKGDQRRPLKTRNTTDLKSALLMTTFPEVGRYKDRAGFQAVEMHVKLTRYGLDCYAYALVAAGQIDLVIEAGLASYDVAGPIGVVEAAGGIVTTWSGKIAVNGGQIVVAANEIIHARALEILSEFAD